nr:MULTISPECIES: lysozyme inhibitor LprI family protein [Bizionia]
MNDEANNEFRKADAELNNVYQKIITEYKTDSIFIERLKKTQRIWISYRDAELEMKFPAEDKRVEYGSVFPMCVSYFLGKLTEERTEKLKIWLDGIEEGDVCSGSVKSKYELDPTYYSKAYIEKDSTIWIPQNINSEIKIFGYQEKDSLSKKLILISVFTKDVEDNPYNCKYGSYYHTQSMNNIKLKYLSTENEFMKIAILKKGTLIDTVYMEKKWFEFSEE